MAAGQGWGPRWGGPGPAPCFPASTHCIPTARPNPQVPRSATPSERRGRCPEHTQQVLGARPTAAASPWGARPSVPRGLCQGHPRLPTLVSGSGDQSSSVRAHSANPEHRSPVGRGRRPEAGVSGAPATGQFSDTLSGHIRNPAPGLSSGPFCLAVQPEAARTRAQLAPPTPSPQCGSWLGRRKCVLPPLVRVLKARGPLCSK